MICMIIIFVFEAFMSTRAVAASGTESRIVERVSRRQNNDIHYIINNTSTGMNCGDKDTYLISEDH